MRRLAALAPLVVLLATPPPADGATDGAWRGLEGAERPLVIVALVDGVDTAAWLEDPPPFLRDAARRGGIGLLSVRTDGSRDAASAYLTLAAGGPSRAGPLAGLALDGDEQLLGLDAAAVHRLRADPEAFLTTVGATSPSPSAASDPGRGEERSRSSVSDSSVPEGREVVHLGFWEQDALNRPRPYGSRPGRLGTRWAQEGLRVAVLGNGDVPGEKRRYGALFAADDRGVVPRGWVGAGTLTVDPRFPFGPRTDYEALLAAARTWAPDLDILVVELGDLSRLAPFYRALPPSAYQGHYAAALRRIDGFLSELVAGVRADAPDRTVHLWFVSPSPAPAQREAGVYLSALAWAPFFAGPESEPPADGFLLRSPSTRRPGLVAGDDVAEALLASARGEGPYLAPAPPASLEPHLAAPLPAGADPWRALAVFHRRAAVVNAQRPPILRAYVSYVIGVLIAWSAWRAALRAAGNAGYGRGGGAPRGTGDSPGRLVARLARPLLLSVIAVPTAMLLTSPLLQDSLTANVALIAALAGALTAASLLPARGSRLAPFLRLAWLSAVLVTADVMRGAPWMKGSFLGYDPIVGARFYGIGNEYMGFLTGSLLVGSCAALDDARNPRPWLYALPALYSLVAFIIFWPDAGANVGGGITAFVSFGVTAYLIWRRRRRRKEKLVFYAALGIALAVGFGAAGLWDASRGAQGAHWGRFLTAVQEGGWEAAADVVARKVQLNMRLFRATIWSRALVLSLALTAWLLWWPPQGLRRLFARRRHLITGLRGAVVASLVAFLVNDSGVVAAATALIPATATLLYLVSDPCLLADAELGGAGRAKVINLTVK